MAERSVNQHPTPGRKIKPEDVIVALGGRFTLVQIGAALELLRPQRGHPAVEIYKSLDYLIKARQQKGDLGPLEPYLPDPTICRAAQEVLKFTYSQRRVFTSGVSREESVVEAPPTPAPEPSNTRRRGAAVAGRTSAVVGSIDASMDDAYARLDQVFGQAWRKIVDKIPPDKKKIAVGLLAGWLAIAGTHTIIKSSSPGSSSNATPSGELVLPPSLLPTPGITPSTKPSAIPIPTPTRTPEPIILGQDGITAEQRKIIDETTGSLDEKQKKFIINATATIMKLRTYAAERHVRLDVMLAQAIVESGYGQSKKATKHHNYFGMKADSSWNGDFFYDTSATERDPTQQIKWRKYKNMYEGFKGYIDALVSKPWYDDARAHYDNLIIYVRGIQNELNPDGSIRVAGKLAWDASNPKGYENTLINDVKKFQLTYLTYPELIPKPTPTTRPTRPEIIVQGGLNPDYLPGNIRIDLGKYPLSMYQYEWVLGGKDSYVIYHGKKYYLNRDIGQNYELRYKIIEENLNGVRVSPEGYAEWERERFKDVSARVKAEGYADFDGEKNGLGTFPRNANIPFVMHATITPNSANGKDCMGNARIFDNTPNWTGSVYYINNSDLNSNGTRVTCQLTHDRVWHVKRRTGKFSTKNTMGVEIAACGMEAITSKQYEDLIYLIIWHLKKHSELKNGKSVSISKVVKSMLRGHAEVDAGLYDAHGDFKSPIADVIRGITINLGIQLGYRP